MPNWRRIFGKDMNYGIEMNTILLFVVIEIRWTFDNSESMLFGLKWTINKQTFKLMPNWRMLFGMVQPSEQRHTIRKTVGCFKDFKALSVSQVSNQERRMFGSRWTINKQTNKQTFQLLPNWRTLFGKIRSSEKRHIVDFENCRRFKSVSQVANHVSTMSGMKWTINKKTFDHCSDQGTEKEQLYCCCCYVLCISVADKWMQCN